MHKHQYCYNVETLHCWFRAVVFRSDGFVQEGLDGTFFLEYRLTSAGTYTLQAQYDGEALGAEFTVVSSAGSTIRPDRCLTSLTGWDGNSATVLEAGASLGVSITARDSGAAARLHDYLEL